MPGIAGVVGADEGPFASTIDQTPALQGFEAVMELAEPVEKVEDRVVGQRPVDTVVGLEEVRPGTAPFCGTGREHPVQGGLLVGIGAPAQVAHAHNVLALGHDSFQERVAGVHDVVYGLGADRAEAGYLAGLAINGIAAQQCRVVDPDQYARAR
jgi:hypothetical protein